MSLIILKQLEAKPRKMFRHGKYMSVMTSAFVGAIGGDLAQLGLGLIDDAGSAMFWGLLCPHCLITAWRGMQVLDQISHIQSDTLCNCYYAGKRENDPQEAKRTQELLGLLPNITELRTELLSKHLSDAELDEMLKICNAPNNGISVATWELKDEIEAGIINRTEEVERVFTIAEEERQAQERDEAFSKQPLPESESFRKFCEDVGLLHPCDVPIGAYDWDWGHCPLKTIDREVVYSGLRFGHSRSVYCTEKPAEAKDFGQVGQPVLRLSDNRELVLLEVEFKNPDMWLSVRPFNADPEAEPEKILLRELRALSPQMVGITFAEGDKISLADIMRGYVALEKDTKDAKAWLCSFGKSRGRHRTRS